MNEASGFTSTSDHCNNWKSFDNSVLENEPQYMISTRTRLTTVLLVTCLLEKSICSLGMVKLCSIDMYKLHHPDMQSSHPCNFLLEVLVDPLTRVSGDEEPKDKPMLLSHVPSIFGGF